MSAEVSFTKRAAAELSRCFNGITVSRQSTSNNSKSAASTTSATGKGLTDTTTTADSSTSQQTTTSYISHSNEPTNQVPSKTVPTNGSVSDSECTECQSNCKTISACDFHQKVERRLDDYNCKTVDSLSEQQQQQQIESKIIVSNNSPSNQTDQEKSVNSNLCNGGIPHYRQFLSNSSNKTLINESITQLNEIYLNMNQLVTTTTTSSQREPSRKGPPPKAPPKTIRARRKNYLLNLNKPTRIEELFMNVLFLKYFFTMTQTRDRCTLTQVCKTWCHVLYSDSHYWKEITLMIDYKRLRQPLTTSVVASNTCAQSVNIAMHSNQVAHGTNMAPPPSDTTDETTLNGPLTQNRLQFDEQKNDKTATAAGNSYMTKSDAFSAANCSTALSILGSGVLASDTATSNPDALYAQLLLITNCNEVSSKCANELNQQQQKQLSTLAQLSNGDSLARLYYSLKLRGIDSICLQSVTDLDIIEFTTQATMSGVENLTHVIIRHSKITDKGLEVFLASVSRTLYSLELYDCNEISNSGLWIGLVPNIKFLAIRDCINLSDETIAALCQLLTSLRSLYIQGYHVTDVSMAFFSTSMVRDTMRTLALQHCWEITDQGVVNLAHSLPNLTSLSLSGCSKITDISIEVLSEQLRSLQLLDLSWCPRISDISLESIACDLSSSLQTLILDRCPHITDKGLGYVTTMDHLKHLSLRWCPNINDLCLQTLLSLRSLRVLSIAGCSHVTLKGLLVLTRMQQLEELELTNCPPATRDVVESLEENLPKSCLIIV